MDRSTDSAPKRVYDETILDDPQVIDAQRLTLHAERAQIVKRNVEGRRAIITRRAVNVRKTIEVDVLHEELQIVYEPGNGTELLGNEPESIVVRLHAEEIEIVKHVRVVEEVVLSKRRVVETKSVAVALAHEELRVLDAMP